MRIFKQLLLFFSNAKLKPENKETVLINEQEANIQMSKALLIIAAVLLIGWILNLVGIFQTGDIIDVALPSIIILTVSGIIGLKCNGNGKWLRYMVMGIFIIVSAFVDSKLSFNVVLLMVLPVILSCRYCSTAFTGLVSLVTLLCFAAGSYLGASGLGRLDLNYYDIIPGTTLFVETTIRDAVMKLGIDTSERVKSYMLLYFVPKAMLFLCASFICVKSAMSGYKRMMDEANLAVKTSRIESELNLATDIQANMLPRIFPTLPGHDEFAVFATMEPAKEVGGDFYDYFMVDDTHVAMIVADVSGKGVPAALFMVTAKTLIKDHMQMGLTPAEAFTRVNNILCDGNEAGLFVTAWMGMLDFKTGKLTYVNAGHNPPLLFMNGTYQYLKTIPGFVLAGLEGFRYKQAELMMHPGDRLFLYTDGVTESTNTANELYGENRLLEFLNRNSYLNIQNTLGKLRKDLDTFANGAEQFDDITMMLFEYKSQGEGDSIEKVFPAVEASIAEAIAFVEDELIKAEAPMKVVTSVTIAVEELVVNIVHYAYPGREGRFKVSMDISNNQLKLTLRDTGIYFNPLDKQDPDITLSSEERNIGGLGIFLVKKTMDDVQYEYKDGVNTLRILKKW